LSQTEQHQFVTKFCGNVAAFMIYVFTTVVAKITEVLATEAIAVGRGAVKFVRNLQELLHF